MGVEIKVWLPCDLRYVATARLIAIEFVREAGGAGGAAETFVGQVEEAARHSLAVALPSPHVTMAVTREPDALVVTIDDHTVRLTL
jgi:hypothetical protein